MTGITITVFRFNPAVNPEPYFQDFKLDLEENMTVLDALHMIKEKFDGSLSFRRSCRSNICGSCAVNVNGRAILICKTQVKEAVVNDKMLIEPVGNMPVIKDLVVDMDIFWDKLKSAQPWLSTGYKTSLPEQEFRMQPEVVRELDKTTDCIMCGICYSICESIHSNQEYFGPHVMAKTYRFVADSRDHLGPERAVNLVKLTGDAIWLCVDCNNCEEFCPQNVKVLESGYQLRRAAYTKNACHPGLVAAKSDLEGRGKLLEISEFEETMRSKYKIQELTPRSESAVKIIEIVDDIRRQKTRENQNKARPREGGS